MHTFVEWIVHTMLEADMSDNQNWFTTGSNEGMTATDTQKNSVGLRPYIYCQVSHDCPCGRLT
jgi:hypothetical protein